MEEDSIQKKQLYLRKEIIMNGYDAQDFSIFLANLKGEEKIDLEYWTFEEIQNSVESYKKLKLMEKESKLKSKNEKILTPKKHKFKYIKNLLKRRQSSAQMKTKNYNFEEKSDKNKIIKIKNENSININTIKNSESISNNNQDVNSNSEQKINNQEESEIIKEINNEKIIKCQKLEKNEITERMDLNIIVNNYTKIKKLFVNSVLFNIETNPIGLKTTRKLEDFEYLYQKLILLNSQIFVPYLPSNLNKKDSNSHILFLNLFMNDLINIKYYRTLPIVYDFLSLTIEDWEKSKMEKYDKIKEISSLTKIQNLEGYFNCDIKQGDKDYFFKIKDEINRKTEAFNKFNNSINELFNIMEKLGSVFNNIKESLTLLKDNYSENDKSLVCFAIIEEIVKTWGEGYIKQKKYLNEELKNFFFYMNKENKSFAKYYEPFKTNYEVYKSKYEKTKNISYNKKELEIKNNSKKVIKCNIINANSQYKKLIERQSLRIENLLIRLGHNQQQFFNDIYNFLSLINIFNDKGNEVKKFLENNKKIYKNLQNINNNEKKE